MTPESLSLNISSTRLKDYCFRCVGIRSLRFLCIQPSALLVPWAQRYMGRFFFRFNIHRESSWTPGGSENSPNWMALSTFFASCQACPLETLRWATSSHRWLPRHAVPSGSTSATQGRRHLVADLISSGTAGGSFWVGYTSFRAPPAPHASGATGWLPVAHRKVSIITKFLASFYLDPHRADWDLGN
jgi:hypothetical protein